MISNLRLQNFRSYTDESFEFEDGVNIVVGPNGSGKTNLLEAVLVLGRGSSYRAKDIDLIKHSKPWARLDGYFGSHTRTVKLETINDVAAKSFDLDSKLYKRLNLERTVPLVLFEPNHLQMLTRGPDQRREYVDDLLERSQAGFKALLGQYRRTLAQRNSLLKQGPGRAQEQLFAWDIRLSELGSKIAESRQALVVDINSKLSKIYSQIAAKKVKAAAEYKAQFPPENYASRMLSKLGSNARLDFERGFTTSGPHREDIAFTLAGQPIVYSASRGETRSLLLSLKIYELELISKARGQKPIFLLDDVFSELDGARRRALVEYLKDHQTIITTTEADAVIEYFSSGTHNLIPISSN
jgi:DNA replication and repair protein RecF